MLSATHISICVCVCVCMYITHYNTDAINECTECFANTHIFRHRLQQHIATECEQQTGEGQLCRTREDNTCPLNFRKCLNLGATTIFRKTQTIFEHL